MQAYGRLNYHCKKHWEKKSGVLEDIRQRMALHSDVTLVGLGNKNSIELYCFCISLKKSVSCASLMIVASFCSCMLNCTAKSAMSS